MTDKDRENTKAWIDNWKKTGKVLQKLRRAEYQNADLAETILALSDASDAALMSFPPKPTSGLIEMQRLLSKLKKR